MPELLIPEHQPSFPHVDVSETNAQLFRQLLLEPAYIEHAHTLAESHVAAFRLGHQTLRSLGYAIFKTQAQQTSFSFGATIYEALSTTVRPLEQPLMENRYIQRKVGDLMDLRSDGATAIMNILDEEERLTEEAPETAKLISTAAEYRPTIDQRLALWGAALERSIDKDTIDTPLDF